MTAKSFSFLLVDYLLGLSDETLDGFSDTDTKFGRMIYRDALPMKLERSGKRAVLIRTGSPDAGGRVAYGSSVSVSCYSDHTTLLDGSQPVEDSVDRAFDSWGKLDLILGSPKPLLSDDPFIQSDRIADPLESFDFQQNVAYVVAIYGVKAVVST